VGSAVANPTDLIKVRMQAPPEEYTATTSSSSTLHQHKRQRYSGVWHAVKTIYHDEGWRGYYKGVGPTVQRACVLTGTQIPSYDHSKHLVLHWVGKEHDGLLVHFVCSMFAGLVCSTATSPIDVIKSRVMNQPYDQQGRGTLYTSNLDCWLKTIRHEGLLGLYRGWLPNWLRLGPHTVISFMLFEQMRKAAGLQTL